MKADRLISSKDYRSIAGIMPLTNRMVVAVVAPRQPRLRSAGDANGKEARFSPKRCTAERGADSSQREEFYHHCRRSTSVDAQVQVGAA